jgi:hypothetical protein
LEVLNQLSKEDLEIYEEAYEEDGSYIAFQFACSILENSDEFIESIVDKFLQEYEETMTK